MWQQKAQKAEELRQIKQEQNSGVTNEGLNNLEQEVNKADSNVDVNVDQVE